MFDTPEEQLALAALCDAPLPDIDRIDAEAFYRICRGHGVMALVANRLRDRDVPLPGAIAQRLVDAANAAAVYEKLHLAELRQVLDVLLERGIEPVLLKGTPMAYWGYESPATRARGDTDLLVAPAQWEATLETFRTRGYERFLESGGDLQSYQTSFEAEDAFGCRHVFDVHRQISNRQVFAAALPPEELHANTMQLPGIHSHARTLTPIYLLLHACLHRIGHLHLIYRIDGHEHFGDRLLWLYDIRLLADTLSPDEWQRFADLSRSKGFATLVSHTLETTRSTFGGSWPENITAELATVEGEASAALLSPSAWKQLASDVESLPTWRSRLRLLREIAFPPPDYMLRHFGKRSRAWLPALYAWRGLRGVLRYSLPGKSA